MDYEIMTSEDKSYILVCTYKPISRQMIFEINQKVVKQAETSSIIKFLYDVRNSPNDESVMNNYNIAYEDAKTVGFGRTAKIAVLHNQDDSSHEFVMTVAKNSGYNFRLFISKQDVVAWLAE